MSRIRCSLPEIQELVVECCIFEINFSLTFDEIDAQKVSGWVCLVARKTGDHIDSYIVTYNVS